MGRKDGKALEKHPQTSKTRRDNKGHLGIDILESELYDGCMPNLFEPGNESAVAKAGEKIGAMETSMKHV